MQLVVAIGGTKRGILFLKFQGGGFGGWEGPLFHGFSFFRCSLVLVLVLE